MSDRISIVIPLFNNAATVERAAASLIETAYPALEILIVDDGSLDNGRSVAQDLVRRWPGTVRLVDHEDGSSHGVSATRNLGIQAATGRYIGFLDADDYVYPHRFDASLRLFAQDPTVDGVHESTLMVFEDESGRSNWPGGGSWFGLSPVSGPQVLGELLRGVCWATSAILVKRELLERTGGFDPELRVAEDCNLWIRMACVGNIVSGNSDTPVSAYVRHDSNNFRPDVARKVDMVRAMSRAHRWAGRQRVPREIRAHLERMIQEYVLGSIVATREAGRPDLALRVISAVMREGFVRAMLDARLSRQLPHVLFEIADLRHLHDA